MALFNMAFKDRGAFQAEVLLIVVNTPIALE